MSNLCLKAALKYYKLVLNIVRMTINMTSFITVREAVMWEI